VQPIGRIRVGSGVTDGDSSGGGEEECRRASGSRCAGLESQRMGRGASQR
jgi:hypothetical protein